MEQYEKIYLYKRIVQAKLFIDNHYSEKIDIDNIADQAYFSKFHFIRLFKAVYGRSPHNYLIKVRIDKARLLLTEDAQVLAVCLMVGFDSPTSFTATFKKIVGKTPISYRNEQKTKRQAINDNPLSAIPNCFAQTHGWSK